MYAHWCRFLPAQDDTAQLQGQDRFVLAVSEDRPPQQYGLQQRSRPHHSGPTAAVPEAAVSASEGTLDHSVSLREAKASSRPPPVGTEGAPAGLRFATRPGRAAAMENGHDAAARGPTWMQKRKGGLNRPNTQDAEADVLR